MTEVDPTAEGGAKRAVRTTWIALILCTALVGLVILLQAAQYSGLFASVAEWQFQRFGQWLPVFSFLAFLAIPALLVGAIAWLIGRRKRSEAPGSDLFTQWLAAAEAFRQIMNRIAIGLLLIAVAVMVVGFITANGGTPARMAGNSGVSQGSATLIPGTIDRKRSATLVLDLLLVERDIRYAPVIDPSNPNLIRYFVELPGQAGWDNDSRGETEVFDEQVPGPIRTLYSSIGYNVPADVRLVNGSTITLIWPYLTAAVHLLLGALIALGIARLQAHRIERVRKQASGAADEAGTLPAG